MSSSCRPMMSASILTAFAGGLPSILYSCGAIVNTEKLNMAPVLYKIEPSPPANAVRILADIIGLELELKDVDMANLEHKSPDYLKLNPAGVVPTLVDDGFAVGDSHAIMIYLVSKYGGNKSEFLYPSDLRTRAIINQVMLYNASILFSRNSRVGMAMIFEGLKGPSERHISDVEEAYGMLERFLSKYRYVAANHLTIADISLATSLYVSVLIKEIDPEIPPDYCLV
ncbi:unnamed protein product [Chrysodeixis includens]|uniref:Glutathione S-transferase n=1 Tax=Chrysodeixis includens TaxID=689277 RepID=A0A9P0C0H6_CHRIL|nr:unnamed protein product [Chrysodeixis includens]